LHSLRAYAVYFVGAENLKWNLPGRSHVARISGIVEFAPRTKCHTRPRKPLILPPGDRAFGCPVGYDM